MPASITSHGTQRNNRSSFYHITICGGVFRNDNQHHIRDVVTENQQTLETLILTDGQQYYWPLTPRIDRILWFQSVNQMPHLQTLACRSINYDTIVCIHFFKNFKSLSMSCKSRITNGDSGRKSNI